MFVSASFTTASIAGELNIRHQSGTIKAPCLKICDLPSAGFVAAGVSSRVYLSISGALGRLKSGPTAQLITKHSIMAHNPFSVDGIFICIRLWIDNRLYADLDRFHEKTSLVMIFHRPIRKPGFLASLEMTVSCCRLYATSSLLRPGTSCLHLALPDVDIYQLTGININVFRLLEPEYHR